MSNIASIKNVCIYQDLGTDSDFYQAVNIANKPDQCIIRSITYAGPNTDIYGAYIIWSDLINDFIGSFSVSADTTAGSDVTFSATTCPQTTLHFPNPINNMSQIHFVIYGVNAGTRQAETLNGALSGDLVIQLDFIKYKTK